jgi:hypothetical protein
VFEIDENDIFTGSPRSKFFDIFLSANKNLVEDVLEKNIEKFAAMELLLQDKLKNKFEEEVNRMIFENPDAIEQGKNDFFISCVSEILSRHE